MVRHREQEIPRLLQDRSVFGVPDLHRMELIPGSLVNRPGILRPQPAGQAGAPLPRVLLIGDFESVAEFGIHRLRADSVRIRRVTVRQRTFHSRSDELLMLTHALVQIDHRLLIDMNQAFSRTVEIEGKQ